MIILNTEKLPHGRGVLQTIQTHGGLIMSHTPKGGETSLRRLRMDEVRALRDTTTHSAKEE